MSAPVATHRMSTPAGGVTRGSRTKFCVTCCLDATVIPVTFLARKPAAVASTEYVPAPTVIVYSPAAFVWPGYVRVPSVARTVAPAIAPPVLAVTVPIIQPAENCSAKFTVVVRSEATMMLACVDDTYSGRLAGTEEVRARRGEW